MHTTLNCGFRLRFRSVSFLDATSSLQFLWGTNDYIHDQETFGRNASGFLLRKAYYNTVTASLPPLPLYAGRKNHHSGNQ